MRTWATVVSILIVAAAPALAHKEESLQELKGRAESARLEDRPSLCIEIAKRQLKAADQLYTEGKVEEGRAAVQELSEEWLNSGDGGKVYEIRAEVGDLPQ